ncbi:MAG: cyclic nucleotide-binding domain-containing protein [Gemmatimonadetes bacterium]|nr:cyclic nucleotide-binding domain-containing protein [Gemmatimonadota bacterium]
MDLTPGLLSTLQKLHLFQELSPTQIKRLFTTCQQETFDPGEELCRVGKASDNMHIVLTGKVDILSAQGIVLATESAITTIGETGLLSGETRSATVIATEPVTSFAIGRRPLLQVMQNDAALAIRLYRNAMVLVREKLIAADLRLESILARQDRDEEDD